MNEFEKWWLKEYGSGAGSRKYTIAAEAAAAQLAWKAALEWVLEGLTEQWEHTAQGDTGWQGGFIEQELEG